MLFDAQQQQGTRKQQQRQQELPCIFICTFNYTRDCRKSNRIQIALFNQVVPKRAEERERELTCAHVCVCVCVHMKGCARMRVYSTIATAIRDILGLGILINEYKHAGR